MRIVIDARMINWTGVGRYTRNLLDNLQQIDNSNKYVVILLAGDKPGWRPDSSNFKTVKIDAPAYHPIKEQWQLLRFIKKLNPDVVHFTAINRPGFYKKTNVTTIHDLNMLDKNQVSAWYKAYKWLGIQIEAQLVVKNSQRLIVPLEHTAAEVIHHFAAAKGKIEVIYEAGESLSKHPQPLTSLKSSRYLLYVGNALPNKNLPLLIEGFGLIAKRQPTIKLAIAGDMGFAAASLRDLAIKYRVEDKIHWLGFVKEDKLAWAYQQAEMVVLPSLAEGFGLQVLEAFAANTPVVAAANGAYPEVGAEAALYFNPHQPRELAEAVLKVLDNPALAHQLRQRGQERLKNFSWKHMAQQTLDVYNELNRS